MGASTSTREQLRAAEQRVADRIGVALQERTLTVTGPVGHVRVLESGAGAPLVMVHGGGGFGAQWLPLMAALPERRCIAPERPGCGLTDDYIYARDEDIRAHAVEYLDGVLDALGIDSAHLAANSMGALWSLWFALERPERVQSLTTLGCPALVVGTSAPYGMRLLSRRGLDGLMNRPRTSAGTAKVIGRLGHDATTLDGSYPGLLEVSRLAGNLPGAGASFASLLNRVLALRGAKADCALGAGELAGLEVCPLVLWGSGDPFGDVGAARCFADATHGRLHVLGTGHAPWLDDPGAAAARIEAHLSGRDESNA